MVVCVLFPYPVSNLDGLIEACYRLTPRMAVRTVFETDDQTKNKIRYEALFLHLTKEPTPLLTLRLQHLCGRFGLKDHQIGWSTAAPLALARARFRNEPVRSLPLSVLSDLARPFETDPLIERKMNDMALLLKKLGLKTAGDFMKLQTSSLSSRFGEEALLVHRVLNEGFEPPWPRIEIPEKIIEETDLEVQEIFVPLETLEPLLFLLKGALNRVSARLFGRNERAVSLKLEFECRRVYLGMPESHGIRQSEIGTGGRASGSGPAIGLNSKREWSFTFPVPQRSFQTIFPILKEKVYFDLQHKPLEAPVTLLRITVLETAPGAARQKDFFHNREQEQEIWSSLVARLCQKLGENQIYGAEVVSRHLPEKAWRALLREPEVSPHESSMHEIKRGKAARERLRRYELERNESESVRKKSLKHSGETPGFDESVSPATTDTSATPSPIKEPNMFSAAFYRNHDSDSDSSQEEITRPYSRFGTESKKIPTPVPGQVLGSHASSPLSGLARRPTRLLPKPRVLNQDGDWLMDLEAGKKWKVLDWDGPERISGEWWEKGGFAREYFRVLTEDGEQLWLFFADKEIFLHGFYD